MPDLAYRVVDVFTERALEGNALAVFLDGSALDGETMQKIAREMNLSETVFVLPSTRPGCVARIRIFTPAKELVFAGHPTIGAAFVLKQEAMVGAGCEEFCLDENVGPVAIRVETGVDGRPLIWLRTPPIEFGVTYDPARCAQAVGLKPEDLLPVAPQRVSAGNPTVFIPVKDKPAVDRAFLEMQGLRTIKDPTAEPLCIFVFTPTPEGAYSRMFAPEHGIVEDPATGSSTGPLAAFMMRYGLVASHPGHRFLSEQGTKMGRRSLLHIHIAGEDTIEVGGHVTPLVKATMELPGL